MIGLPEAAQAFLYLAGACTAWIFIYALAKRVLDWLNPGGKR